MMARRIAAAALSSLLAATAVPAAAQGYYTINGYPADAGLTGQLMAMGLPFGNYWLRGNGDWGVVGSPWPAGNIYGGGGSAGGSGVLGGSGERYGDGSWSYSPGAMTGAGAVGGDGNGCYYTAGWSNC